VDGTKEILRLSLTQKRKYLFHISSLSVLDVHDGNGNLETIPQNVLFRKLNNAQGYSQSKFVSEMLVHQAHAKLGVPAVIFRPTTISGDTKSGYSNIRDSVNILVAGIAVLGLAPTRTTVFDMCPVDYVAKSIVHISKTATSSDRFGKTYHYTNSKGVVTSRQLLEALEKNGFQVQKIDYDEWVKKVTQSPDLPLYTLLSHLPGFGGLPHIDERNSLLAWSEGVDCDVIDDVILQKYCGWLAEKGRWGHPRNGI